MAKKTKKAGLFLQALANNRGNVTKACEAVGINRCTYYRWLEDEDFKNEVDNVSEGLLDLAEDQLQQKIEHGDTASIIFYLKTKGKKRGFVERVEKEISGNRQNPLIVPEEIFKKL